MSTKTIKRYHEPTCQPTKLSVLPLLFLKQDLIIWPRLALNSQPSYIILSRCSNSRDMPPTLASQNLPSPCPVISFSSFLKLATVLNCVLISFLAIFLPVFEQFMNLENTLLFTFTHFESHLNALKYILLRLSSLNIICEIHPHSSSLFLFIVFSTYLSYENTMIYVIIAGNVGCFLLFLQGQHKYSSMSPGIQGWKL